MKDSIWNGAVWFARWLWAWDWTDAISALSGLATIAVTVALWRVATRQNELHARQQEHFRRTERAYLAVRFLPPGVSFDRVVNSTDWMLHADVAFENLGNTPAQVRRYGAKLEVLRCSFPAFQTGHSGGTVLLEAVLMKNEQLPVGTTLTLTEAAKDAIDENNALFLVGFVEYSDIFDGVHRRTFVRRFDSRLDDATRPEYRRSSGGGMDPEKYRDRLNLTIPYAPGYNVDFTLK